MSPQCQPPLVRRDAFSFLALCCRRSTVVPSSEPACPQAGPVAVAIVPAARTVPKTGLRTARL